MVDDVVTKAKYFAIGAHGLQERKYTKEPYYIHLEEVCLILEQHTHVNESMLAAAWLHDVVEDTPFSIFHIQDLFGEQIASYVSALTEPQGGNRAERHKYYNEQLSVACNEVQTIKYADLISNTSSIVARDPNFARIYLREKRELLAVMNKGDPNLYKMACQLAKLEV